jgi:hypothetical protein
MHSKALYKVYIHPEINIQVSTPSKFPVADLEGDGHLVVGVQLFVEAFSRVCFELDVVCGGEAKKCQRGS